LIQQGVLFPQDYQAMGSWFSAEGAGGYSNKREQFLYSPLSVRKNIDSCLLKRDKK
jgi:hypothetical protein